MPTEAFAALHCVETCATAWKSYIFQYEGVVLVLGCVCVCVLEIVCVCA